MNTQVNQISIEALAKHINGNLWTKRELKRIYVDRGWNTKKMSTKTYIYQNADGTFGVSCYIDCPSQPYSWIKSQTEEVIAEVEKEIETALLQISAILVDFKVTEEHDCQLMVYVKEGSDAEPVWYTEDSFYDKFNCMPTTLFDSLPKIERVPVIVPVVEEKQTAIQPIKQNTETPSYGINTKVKHSKFGVGTVTAENDTKIDIIFDSVGTKQLVKQFVKLEVVE